MRIIEIANILKDHPNLKHKFQDLLPELIRKLIKETSSSIAYNRFPSRDATGTPGIDGIVKNNTDCEFIPIGDSFWEIGTSGLQKINSDYNKRTKNIPENIRRNTTFILILHKYWGFDKTISIVDWQNERKDQWKDVIVYDAEILNNWMENHINVTLWFLKELNITQNLLDCHLVENSYYNLISSTNPKFNSQIFCEGREDAKNKFINDLSQKNIIYVKSESRFESLGFILSSIIEEEINNYKNKCIVINDRSSYNFINNSLNEKILILNFENTNDLKLENNKLIIPCYKSNFLGEGIDLPIRGQRTMSKLLSDLGLDTQQSTDINYKSNGNLLIIRRLLSKDLIDRQPKWVNKQDIFCIVPLMLLQKFDINNKSHLEVAKYITNLDKDIFLQKLLAFSNMEDCPFRIIGNIYQLYNLEESWFALKQFLPSFLFEKICKIVKYIYFNNMNSNNEFILSKGDFTNKDLDSILKILVFYAIDSEQNQLLVDKEIMLILNINECNQYLINKNLHILAECSPKSVCDFLEKEIENSSKYLINLLNSNDYCSLLSSINYLLCLNVYKFRAINLLFKLLDYDIQYCHNNPKSDLKEALIPYFNKNALSIQDKLNILKFKIDTNINIIDLYIEIIKTNNCCYSINFNVRKPEYSEPPTYIDLKSFQEELNNLVIEKILNINSIQMIYKVIDNYYLFSPEVFNRFSIYFKHFNREFDDDSLYIIYKIAIEKLSIIRKYQYNENWTTKKIYINPLIELINSTKPKDCFLQYKYLFEKHSDCIDIEDYNKELNFDEIEKRKINLRKNALQTLTTMIGKKETINLYIKNVSDNYFWAKILVDLFFDLDTICLIFDDCIKYNKYNFLSQAMDLFDDKETIITIFKEKISLENKIKILPLLNSDKYEMLCDNDYELELFYSQKSIKSNHECNDEIYQKLLKYNPLGLLNYFYDKLFDDEIYYKGISLLNILNKNKTKIDINGHSWELKELLKKLESYRYSEELALLELDFIEIYDRFYPDALIEYWFRNPKIFIKYFRSENEEKYLINNLHFDLRLKQRHFDNTEYFKYFTQTILNENDKSLNSILGSIMGKSCVGSDGIFPHESVREILELNNSSINISFKTGYINSLGAKFVGNGKDEFDRAEKLENHAKILGIKYPITSNLLIYLSNFHKSTGHEDRMYDLLGI